MSRARPEGGAAPGMRGANDGAFAAMSDEMDGLRVQITPSTVPPTAEQLRQFGYFARGAVVVSLDILGDWPDRQCQALNMQSQQQGEQS